MAKFNTKSENTKMKEFKVKRSDAGLGLFADRSFRRNDFLLEYVGERISSEEADLRGGRYLFEIDDDVTIDGKERANTARYINHACKPNAEAEIDEQRLFIYAKRKIGQGEEITIDYGKEYFDDFIKAGGCRCDSCQTS